MAHARPPVWVDDRLVLFAAKVRIVLSTKGEVLET